MDIEHEIELGALIKLSGALGAVTPLASNMIQGEDEDPAEETSPAEMVSAPVTPGDIGTNVAMIGGIPYLMGRYGVFGAPAMTAGESLAFGLGPGVLPAVAAGNVASWALGPFQDPAYQRGDRGYLGSVLPSIGAQVKAMRRANQEATRRYGVGAVPVQAFHGLLNPLTGAAYGLSSLGQTLLGKSGSLREEARVRISESLR